MILMQRERTLPHVVEDFRARAVLCLQAMHAVQEFDALPELTAFLDQVLDGLVAEGLPRALSRVILFTDQRRAVDEVTRRMCPGHVCVVYKTPGCWKELWPYRRDLERWARRLEPEWAKEQRI